MSQQEIVVGSQGPARTGLARLILGNLSASAWNEFIGYTLIGLILILYPFVAIVGPLKLSVVYILLSYFIFRLGARYVRPTFAAIIAALIALFTYQVISLTVLMLICSFGVNYVCVAW